MTSPSGARNYDGSPTVASYVELQDYNQALKSPIIRPEDEGQRGFGPRTARRPYYESSRWSMDEVRSASSRTREIVTRLAKAIRDVEQAIEKGNGDRVYVTARTNYWFFVASEVAAANGLVEPSATEATVAVDRATAMGKLQELRVRLSRMLLAMIGVFGLLQCLWITRGNGIGLNSVVQSKWMMVSSLFGSAVLALGMWCGYTDSVAARICGMIVLAGLLPISCIYCWGVVSPRRPRVLTLMSWWNWACAGILGILGAILAADGEANASLYIGAIIGGAVGLLAEYCVAIVLSGGCVWLIGITFGVVSVGR